MKRAAVCEVGGNRVHGDDGFGSRAHKHNNAPGGKTARRQLCQRTTPTGAEAIHDAGQQQAVQFGQDFS